MNRGVYFLANDNVYEQSIAFLNSFRVHNPYIPLCLIPYDNEFSRIESLSEKYNFQILNDPEAFNACDDISLQFHEYPLGTYRKLICWQGCFDEFVYIDVDTVVLDKVDFVFQFLNVSSIFTSHSNIPSIVMWVWKNSIYGCGLLSGKQIQYAANTGFIVSRKGTLSVGLAQSKTQDALLLKQHMELSCMEQPFLNYLIVTSVIDYSSLTNMAHEIDSNEFKFEYWAGIPGGTVKDGAFTTPTKYKYFLMHWAGLWKRGFEGLPYKDLWLHYRNLP